LLTTYLTEKVIYAAYGFGWLLAFVSLTPND